ncbi:MAG: hypothetical protein ACLR3R_17445 [Clostridium paraputrificum]
MGGYKYTKNEKDINKVLKLNELESIEAKKNFKYVAAEGSKLISETEELLRSLGYGKEIVGIKSSSRKCTEVNESLELRSWDEIVNEANSVINYDVELEDILAEREFQNAYRDLDRINEEFSKTVKLNKTDIFFLFVAAALQTLRWILTPELGEKINGETRINDKAGDTKVKQKKNEYVNNHNYCDTNKESQGRRGRQREGKSWEEIVYSSVPYDATKGSPAQNVNLEGKYHRYKTLGHDPILGWVFGTANILTDTITLNNFTSYRVEKMKFTSEKVLLPFMFEEAYYWIKDDFHRLPAAVFRQGLHFQSDKYTKLGLPIPILGVFSENISGKLYKNQYDYLCLTKDIKKVGASAGVAVIINMIIGLVHGLFYNEQKDGDRELYEIRTRKILMYSNIIASSSNVIAACITKNPKKLDVGGLMVTLSRLFTDIRFISRVKQEFIEGELAIGITEQFDEADRLFREGI